MRPDRNRSNLVEFVCRFVPASVRFGHEQQTKNARPRLDLRRREDPRRYRLPRSPLGARGKAKRLRRRASFPATVSGRGRRPIKAGSETGAETVGQGPQAPTGLEARSSEIVGLGSVLIKLDLPSVPKSVLLATSSFVLHGGRTMDEDEPGYSAGERLFFLVAVLGFAWIAFLPILYR